MSPSHGLRHDPPHSPRRRLQVALAEMIQGPYQSYSPSLWRADGPRSEKQTISGFAKHEHPTIGDMNEQRPVRGEKRTMM